MTFILDIQYFVAISIYIISVLILSMTISMFGLSVPVVNSFALVSAGVEGWGNSAGQGGGGWLQEIEKQEAKEEEFLTQNARNGTNKQVFPDGNEGKR